MRISGFRNHVKYDESSFEQAMDLSFEAADVNNSILYFDVRTPTGSVMLTDPTLEVVIDIAVTTPQPAYGDVQYVGGQIGGDQSVLLDCGAFPIQSNCSRIVTQLKNIVIEDTECDKYVDKWMSLNHNEAIRVACENTGSEANSHNYMRRPVQGGYVDAHDQTWTDQHGNNETDGITLSEFNPTNSQTTTSRKYLKRNSLRVSQKAPDTALMRRVYRGSDAARITLLEPLVTGLWKGSVRDSSLYNGKKSPFIAYDADFQMRFVLKDLKSMFEQFMSGTGVHDALGNTYFPIFEPTISSATLHVQFAKPLIDIPRIVKYTWPRFRCYTVEHSGSGKIEFPVIRVGEVPHALMVSHRVKKQGLWYDRAHIPSIVNDSGCFVKELSIRHNLSRDNFNLEGHDRSKALQFYTKKTFPHLPTNSLAYTHNQTIGLSRADLNITASALRTMKTEGCIEMGIKMTLDSVNTTRLTYDKNVSVAHPVEIVTNFLNNLFILPTFTIVESFDGSPLDDIQVPVLDANNNQTQVLVIDPMTGEPVVDAATGEPTGELELAFEELASTFDFELFIDPNNNQRKIGKIGKIPGQTPPGQTPNHYGYYYVQWYGDVRYLFLKRKTADNGVQDGKSIMRWVSGEGLEAQFEFWDNVDDDTNFGYGSVGGIGGVGLGAPDAVYRTLDRVADPSVWYLPAEYRSQYSFGRHLQCDEGDIRLLGMQNGTNNYSMGQLMQIFNDNGTAITGMWIDIDHAFNDPIWQYYMISDHSGRYFYNSLQMGLPAASIFSFPHDSPQFFETDLTVDWEPLFISVYQRDQLIIPVPDTVQRSPVYETTVTLVHCDRWVNQETSTMYRREERSAL